MPLPLPYFIEDESIQGNFDELKKQFPFSRKHIKVETPHVVGDAGEPAFQNSWTNWGAPFQSLRFWKDPVGMVHVEGLVKSGGSGTTVFTLPAGWRPGGTHIFGQAADDGAGPVLRRVTVSPSGNVTLTSGASGWLSLSGISFKQES